MTLEPFIGGACLHIDRKKSAVIPLSTTMAPNA
jgi:hypothetical protein